MPSNKCHRVKNCPAYNEFVRSALPLLCTPSEQAFNTCEYVVQTLVQHIETFRKACRCLKKLAEKLMPRVKKSSKKYKGATATTTAKDDGKRGNLVLKKFIKRKPCKRAKLQPQKPEDAAGVGKPAVSIPVDRSIQVKVSLNKLTRRSARQSSSDTTKICEPKPSENAISSDEEVVTFHRNRRRCVIESSESEGDCDTESGFNESNADQESQNTIEASKGCSNGTEANGNHSHSSENTSESNQDGQESVITSTFRAYDNIRHVSSPEKVATVTIVKQEVLDDYTEAMVNSSAEITGQESLEDCVQDMNVEDSSTRAFQAEEQQSSSLLEKFDSRPTVVSSSFVFKIEPSLENALSPVHQIPQSLPAEKCEDCLELEAVDSDEFDFDEKIEHLNDQAQPEEAPGIVSTALEHRNEEEITHCVSRNNRTTISAAGGKAPSGCTSSFIGTIIQTSSTSVTKKIPKKPIEAPVPEVSQKCRIRSVEIPSLDSIIKGSQRHKLHADVSIRKRSSDPNPKSSIHARLGYKEKSTTSLAPSDARSRLSRQNKFKKLPSTEKLASRPLLTFSSSRQDKACSLRNAKCPEISKRPEVEVSRISQPELETKQNLESKHLFADVRLEDVKITIENELSKRGRRLHKPKAH